MDAETQQELRAVVEARKELGPEHEEHLIAGFLEKIDKEIDRRAAERSAVPRVPRRPAEIGIFVPIFLFAGIFGGGLGIAAAAAALALVFVVSELRR